MNSYALQKEIQKNNQEAIERVAKFYKNLGNGWTVEKPYDDVFEINVALRLLKLQQEIKETGMKKHKHYDLIVAWANGEQIEHYDGFANVWRKIANPSWCAENKYRVKTKDIVKKAFVILPSDNEILLDDSQWQDPNVSFTFDSGTGYLKGVELL